jgi:hypothetical protein
MKQLYFFLIIGSLLIQTTFAQTFQEAGLIQDFSENPRNFVVYNHYLFVGGGDYSTGELRVFNIQNPESPALVQTMTYSDSNVWDLLIDGTRLFVVGEDGLKIYDISNPESMTLLTTITQVMDGGTSRAVNSWAIAKSGNTIFVESGWSGLISIDISDIYNPVFLDLMSHTGVTKDIIIYNTSTAFFIDGYNVYKLDISNPSNLSKTSLSVSGDPEYLLLHNNQIVLTSDGLSSDYIIVVDPNSFTQQTEINVNNFAPYEDGYSSSLGGMFIYNDSLVVSASDGLLICAPDYTPAEYIEYSGYGTGAEDIAFYSDHIYVTMGSKMQIYKKHGTNAINDIVANDKYKVYPNPASDFIVIESDKLNFESIEIIEITGKTLKKFKIPNSQFKIRVEDLPKGIYTIKAYAKEGLAVQQFIKE